MIRKLIYKMRKRRFCKLNRWFCPDCIYHDFVFEGAIFRGNRCRYPKYREKERGMTREEAIKSMEYSKAQAEITLSKGVTQYWKQEINWTIEAIDMAIEALKRERTDEWCTGCKEYDTEKKCCPRFNRVIREAMKRIPHDDGTLEVKVEDATKVGRVLISDDKHRGGLYYPDEDEPQSVSFENDTEIKSCSKDSDLISRTDAIDALRYAQHRFTVADEAGGIGSVKWSEDVIYFAAAERVLTELPSADRPRGKRNDIGGVIRWGCSLCHYAYDQKFNFCPNCGADMGGEENNGTR